MLVLMALFMVVGYLIGGSGGMFIAFILASVMNFVSYWYSDKIVLRMYRAREINPDEHPKLNRVVKAVILKIGDHPMPKVYIVPSKASNAFATGRNAEHSAVAVTEGLLEILSEDELEGVIGHEMAHIMNKDMLIGTIAATMAGAIGILASIARWGAIFGGYGRGSNRGGGIGLLVAAIIAPLVALLIQTAISRQREFKADAKSGEITGKHLALASALDKLHKAPVRMNLDDRPATAHLMIINPLSGRGMTAMFSTHPPVEKRIKRLNELFEQSIYSGYSKQ